MSTLRLMREEDVDAVREVDAVAFRAWAQQVSGESVPTYRRTRANVLACRQKDPEGCFVTERDGRVVGFIFSRTWGGVGWFGTFAVLPEYQRQGLGKQLIAASLDYLRRSSRHGNSCHGTSCHGNSCRLIGLETMPESAYNLGLYLKLGFQARFPTFLLTKALDRSAGRSGELPCWSSADAETQQRWLADLRQATGQILPALDYSKEIVSTDQYRMGETLLLLDGEQAVGLSVVWLTSGWEGWDEDRASVQALALQPAHTNHGTFRTLLQASEALAQADDKQTLGVMVNGCHVWALERLLEWGYRVKRVALRMVLKGTGEKPLTDDFVELSRWAG